jgi:3-methylfumaryl-CoA hydratase
MWAGGAIETVRPLVMGAHVSRFSKIADIRMKQGSSGELCLVSILHDICDDAGLCIRERQDLVFREASPGMAPQLGPDQEIASEWMVDASALLLFRFSAITFNGHRIHYDLAHAREEGYPRLLVHGPLQAALMLNLASKRLGHPPRRFVYRCLAPLYGGDRLGVSFEADGARTRIIRRDGFTAAEGQALSQGTG